MSMSFSQVPVGGGIEDACASASLSIEWKYCTMVGMLEVSSIWMCACLKRVFLVIIEKWTARSIMDMLKLMFGNEVDSMVLLMSCGDVPIWTAKWI